jgi:hypothetical protein
MNVSVIINLKEQCYDGIHVLVADYAYRINGKRRKNYGRVNIISQKYNEKYSDYRERMLSKLRSLTKEEVIELVKEHATQAIKTNLKYVNQKQEIEELLKKFSGIKFDFTIK